ncbi:MAG: cysteine peptidase family C39 domain-containing protein [Bacillota bacterium]
MKGRVLIKVPLTHQATSYTCGAAALQSILYYYGLQIRERRIAEKLDSNPEIGTEYQNIVDLAQSLGFSAEVKHEMEENELKQLLLNETPAILLIQAWCERNVSYKDHWGDEHYVVAIGFDEENYYFMDPYTLGNYTYLPQDKLFERWHGQQLERKLNRLAIIVTSQDAVKTYNHEEIMPLQ